MSCVKAMAADSRDQLLYWWEASSEHIEDICKIYLFLAVAVVESSSELQRGYQFSSITLSNSYNYRMHWTNIVAHARSW